MLYDLFLHNRSEVTKQWSKEMIWTCNCKLKEEGNKNVCSLHKKRTKNDSITKVSLS